MLNIFPTEFWTAWSSINKRENSVFPVAKLIYVPIPEIFLKIYLFIFRERGREGEREGEKHQRVVTSCVSPTRDLVFNPGMCPDWESNQRPFGLQAGTQSTEPHQQGLQQYFDIDHFPSRRERASVRRLLEVPGLFFHKNFLMGNRNFFSQNKC